MSLLEDFVSEVEAFLARKHMKPSTFGRMAFGDPNFVYDLRDRGRVPNLDVVERAREFMTKTDEIDREAPPQERASA